MLKRSQLGVILPVPSYHGRKDCILGRAFIRGFVSTLEITGEWRQYWYQTLAESRRLQIDIGQSGTTS